MKIRKQDPNFDLLGFKELLRRKRVASGLTFHQLSLKSGGKVSAQSMNLLENAGDGRFPATPKTWLPLMKVYGISKDEFAEIDKRERMLNWLKDLSDDELKPYPATPGDRTLSKEDLKFLLQIAEGLTKPLTITLALEILEKR